MNKIALLSTKNSLVNSIIFLLFGIILFTNPGEILNFASLVAGSILLIIGVINLIGYIKVLKKLNIEEYSKLVSGILLIILGLVVILFSSLIEITIRLSFGAWIIYSGVLKLIDIITIKSDKVTFWVELIIAILIIICGFYVALTNLMFSMIGLFIMIYSILDIISYVTYKRNTNSNLN